MKPISLGQVRQILNATPIGDVPDLLEAKTVSTDTRLLQPGSLFVALKAERDGTDFLPEAAAQGAVAALVQDKPARRPYNLPLLRVPNTRQALGRLATHIRRQMTAKVIAVGGSNGKTGTKHLIDSALCVTKKGSISPKSFNNDIGVPLAIFPADPSQDYLVLEVGTNHHGEVKVLSEMAQPDVAVITNVGAEHLEGLGDLDGVRREETSIVTGLSPRGCLIVNGDDAPLVSLVSRYSGQIIKFGLNPRGNDLFATDVECDHKGVHFNLNGNPRRRLFVPLLGRHSACNALAAIAVGKRMGIPEDAIADSLANAHAPDMRLQLSKVNGVTVLNDAYNANPNSTRAAIETLVALPVRGRRVAVLGDMLELGRASDAYHREAGVLAANSNLDLLICVGKKAQLIAASAKAAGMEAPRIVTYADATAAARGVTKRVRGSDLILLKASRGVGLEAVARALAESEKKFTRKAAS